MPAKQAETIYRLKVTLKGIRPPIWRRVEVPGGISLLSLHEVLNEAMGWTDTHLHDFTIDGSEYTTPDGGGDWPRPTEDDSRWRLDAVVTQPGARFTYRYDFGDGWEHQVVVEAIGPREAGVVYPRVTAGRRHCPPEDCGGPWGYAELLETLADPGHEQHAELVAWVGVGFDPEAFSIAETNELLADRFSDLRPLRRSTRRVPSGPPDRAASLKRALEPETVKIAADGTIRLPSSVVQSIGLLPGERAVMITVGGGLMVMRDPRTGI